MSRFFAREKHEGRTDEMMTDLEKLKRRWLRKTGEPMPHAVACLEIDVIRRAVQRVEAGDTVFVPGVPVTRVSDETLREWDNDSEF